MNRNIFWASLAAASVAAVFAYRSVRCAITEAERLAHEEERINEMLDESFPASDPPSFTPASSRV
jgi:hypothetical protein